MLLVLGLVEAEKMIGDYTDRSDPTTAIKVEQSNMKFHEKKQLLRLDSN